MGGGGEASVKEKCRGMKDLNRRLIRILPIGEKRNSINLHPCCQISTEISLKNQAKCVTLMHEIYSLFTAMQLNFGSYSIIGDLDAVRFSLKGYK
jgi:hypothetical protein